jgi:phosphatidylglycerol:prolipoprotein diacylglycerol transferase
MSGLPAVITIPIDPIALHLGPVAIHWYGVGYVVAFLVAGWVTTRHVVARGMDRDTVNNLLFWTIVVGLVGARLYYVVQSGLGYYLTHPQFILAVWQGGMAFYGAVFAGVGTLIFLAWRWHLDFWLLLDGAALFATVGQPIGRIGNVINGDILGPPSTLPWATQYTNPGSLAPHLYVPYQPAAVYEALGTLAILGVLLLLRRRGVPTGVIGIVYIALYAVSQFLIPFLRSTEPTMALGLRELQWTAVAVFVLAVPLLVVMWSRTRRITQPPPA